jgi:hypothetical protein
MLAEPRVGLGKHSTVLKVAVVGDSKATNCGLAADAQPFPFLIGELSDGAVEVRNFAEVGLLLDKFLPNVGLAVDWCPDIVLAACGGRESVYRIPKRLKNFPIAIDHSVAGRGLAFPRAWIRRQVWRTIMGALGRRPRLGELLMRLLQSRPYRTPAQYRVALGRLIEAFADTGAVIVILEHFDTYQSQYPWKPSYRCANTVHAQESAAASAGRVLTLDPKQLVCFRGLMISDGVHLSAEGHLVVAKALLPQLISIGQSVSQ